MNSEEFDFDNLFGDMPKEKQLGFYDEHPLDLSPDFEDVVTMLDQLSEAKEVYIDEDDYEWRIIEKTIDEKNQRMAWVEWRYKEGRGEYEYHNYYLKFRDSANNLTKWEIETYNPYFGCDVKFLEWVNEYLIMIYREKHDTFAVRINKDERERIEITHDWKIEDGILIYADSKKLKLANFELIN